MTRHSKMLTLSLFVALTLLSSLVPPSLSDIPKIISYQGKVTDTGGTPIPDGTYDMQFSIWDSPSGGVVPLWMSGTHNVDVTDGIFNVLLGTFGVTPLDLEFAQDLWLEVTFEGVVQSPRQRFGSVGYAYMASGLVPGTLISGAVGSGTMAALWAANTSGTGTTYGIFGRSNSTQGVGVYGQAVTTSGQTYGVYGQSASTDGGFGGCFTGYHGVRGEGSGADGHGGYFESANGNGVHVESASDCGVYVKDVWGSAGVYVEDTWNGVYVDVCHEIGVFAHTSNTEHEWGLYTPDKLYVGYTIACGGTLTMVAQNGKAGTLEVGDVVAATGVGESFADGDTPIPLVQRADADHNAVVGVVYGRLTTEEKMKENGRDDEHGPAVIAHSDDGPIGPGDHLLIVVLGVCNVRVDGKDEPIERGRRLAASELPGHARVLQTRTLEGMVVSEGTATIGSALASLDPSQSSGIIPVFVTLK